MSIVHPLDERSGKVRSASLRKLGKDGTTWTPTEARTREKLLAQYRKLEVPIVNSAEYQRGYEAIDWKDDSTTCACGHTARCHPGGKCFMKGCDCWERGRER